MKYTYYMPLINSLGVKFVFQGGYEEKDGKIILGCGEVCTKWENFPASTFDQ
jgi:hypothetical protein